MKTKRGYNRKIQLVTLCAHQGRTADPGIIGSVYRCFTTRKFNMNSVAKTLSTHNKIKSVSKCTLQERLDILNRFLVQY